MQKTVLIGGVPRSGKSLLANQIWKKTKLTVFHADHLTNALANNFPQSFSNEVTNQNYASLELILKKLIRNMGKEFQYIRIFESSVIRPRTIEKWFKSRNTITIFLGYGQISPEAKLKKIRSYVKNYPYCWSHGKSDKEMIRWLEQFIKRSQQIAEECSNLSINYIDNSIEFENNQVIALDYILKNIVK